MSMAPAPTLLSFLLMMVSGWAHRHQLIVIEFLQAENQLLRERLRGRRIRFTDADGALLARKAKKAVGRKALLAFDTIVSADTLLRWHRRLRRSGTSPSGAALADGASCVTSQS